jgi:hypothetical protein
MYVNRIEIKFSLCIRFHFTLRRMVLRLEQGKEKNFVNKTLRFEGECGLTNQNP